MPEYEREVELYDYIEVLLKYKWLILVATLVCGGIGWVLRPAPTPPLYEADAVLMVKSLPSTQAGQQAEIPTGSQTSGFYNSLALADDLKQALIDSLDLNMSVVAMDGILGVQVLDPGVRLTVRSHDPELPIKLVNKWAQLFVERNGDLNGEVAGTYYNYVESQYNATRDTLLKTESELRKKNDQSNVESLKLKQATLDTTATNIYREMVELDNRSKQNSLELEEITYLQQSINQSLSSVSKTTKREDLDRVQLAMSNVDSLLKIQLLEFDKKYSVDAIRQRVEVAGIDSIRKKMDVIEDELKNHDPILGGEPNPTYITLSEELSILRMKYQSARYQNNKVTASTDAEKNNKRSVEEAFAILQRREEIVKRSQLMKEILKKQESKLLELQDRDIGNYVSYITAKDSLISENQIIQLRLKSRSKRLQELQREIDDVKNKLSNNTDQLQRLARDRDIFNQTLSRFSKLLEEARIAREKAAGDIRILTRALQVRQVPQEQGLHKATVAAGVGFLLSCILSLLAEYIRKARNNRLAAQQQ